jgi:hypothetical protein
LREEHRLRVFAKWVLRKVFGPKRDEVTGEWRRLHNKEIYDLYFPPNVMWVIKSRRIRWTERVVRMGDRIRVYSVWVGKPEERNYSDDLGIDDKIILRWMRRRGLDCSGSS